MAVNWNRRKYTQEQFEDAWLSSLSIAQVAKSLGCNLSGGGYHTLRNTADELGLSRDHMTGQAWNSGERQKQTFFSRPLSEVLVYGKSENSHKLKLRLIKEGVRERRCEECQRESWMGKPIPLALDHKDGDRKNHLIENLRILCYNCHGLTETFGIRNHAQVS